MLTGQRAAQRETGAGTGGVMIVPLTLHDGSSLDDKTLKTQRNLPGELAAGGLTQSAAE